jgi:hypothetical protein
MKKTFTTITLIFAAITMVGQSLHLFSNKSDVTNGIITVPVVPGQSAETQLSILNTTNDSIHYQVNRTILNPPINDDSCTALYFCAGITCYSPNTAITWTPKTAPISIKAHGSMPDGNGTYGVFAHYDICEDACNDLYIRYRIYNTAANTSDTAFVEIRYTCSNGIETHSKKEGSISDAYPNPSSTTFSINYQMKESSKGQLIMRDIIGKEVQSINLVDREGRININTSQLPAGIYFYSLLVGNTTVATKKVIIQY